MGSSAIKAENPFMQRAIEEALEGINAGDGGPFGAVITKQGEVIASGHNHVLSHHDPTCHGEIDAIRKACQLLGTHDLSGCELYTTGEPCPMCLGAILWANIEKVYYGCTISDNELIGFRDNTFDQLMGGRANLEDFLTQIDRPACLELFEAYQKMSHQLY
ncbi:MAG: nucleoside deaminase [Anaerotardibacter sp.]